MPPLNWEKFAQLPGSAQANFETLCRMLVRRHYERYGKFAALAAQPGVEFHLKTDTACSLGTPGRWYGWQCRWYDLPSGRALQSARRTKIEKSIRNTEKVLPDLSDWVLWTRHPLTKGDQKWFFAIKTKMKLHLWTGAEVEEHLSGEAEIFRSTYFGELVLTPEDLNKQHDVSVAPIRLRWMPEVHQVVDTERVLREMLGESSSWDSLRQTARELKQEADKIGSSLDELNALRNPAKSTMTLAETYARSLYTIHEALSSGDLDLLSQELGNQLPSCSVEINVLPRQLRSRRHVAALLITNTIADIRFSGKLLDHLKTQLKKTLVCVLADVGCGKTQLAAQLTAATIDRPAGMLIHGRSLHANHTLDDLASRVVIHGKPVISMEALIAALNAAGQRAHRKLPLVIDALNEAEDSRTWKPLLAAVQQTLRSCPYVLLICTSRKSFVDSVVPDGAETLAVPDFGHDSIAAIRKYFSYYRINAADVALPIALLKHPLTLRLFCEVTNPKRQQVVGIEAMPKSLTGLFDRYLDQAGTRIADLSPSSHRYFDHDIRAALNDVGSILWEKKRRDIGLSELRNHLGDAVPWNQSIVSALEQEGVLLRYPAEAPEGQTVAVAYDALAGHLIASSILTKFGQAGFETWLRRPETMACLTGGPPDRHPLAADIFRALAGLVPRRLHKQQLWSLVDSSLRTTALRAAADLEATYLDSATVTELHTLVSRSPEGERDIFESLWQTRASAPHPLNAKFLDSALREMTVADRDLRWTEWIRRRHEELLADLQQSEQRWRRATRRSSSERLRARWTMWMLTSTVRELRDRATRALYWFGRYDPPGLLGLVLEALQVNDPYLSERMLAAGYGVCMALHCRPKLTNFRTKLLPKFTRFLYQQMFTNSAPHSTTHVLSRDYARRMIDLGLRYTPSVLTAAEYAEAQPPYKRGGIRNWQSTDDPDEGNYREGNAPLGLDFKNYTIGQLVPNRQSYDFKHKDYKEVVGQINWRVYQLGYSLPAFGEIDKHIASRPYFGRAERPTVERYGKKYARTAYFELYGFRQDAGLLRNDWPDEEQRCPEADVDPSFPEQPHRARIIQDFLGNRSTNVRSWVLDGPTPDFQRYLCHDSARGETGPWLLLDGFCSQQDKTAQRIGHVFLRAFLLLRDDLRTFVRLMNANSQTSGRLPDGGEDHYTFAGEVPWCETFGAGVLDTVDFVTGKVRIRTSPTDPIYSTGVVVNLGVKEFTIGPQKRPEFVEIDKYHRIAVYVPIRHNSFPSAAGIERPSAVVPSKQLAARFGLWLNLPLWDMYDPVGRRCSVSFSEGGFADHEHHLLFRKELLDDLISSEKLGLVWVVWGERQHFNPRDFGAGSQSHGYRTFRQIYEYSSRGGIKRIS